MPIVKDQYPLQLHAQAMPIFKDQCPCSYTRKPGLLFVSGMPKN